MEEIVKLEQQQNQLKDRIEKYLSVLCENDDEEVELRRIEKLVVETRNELEYVQNELITHYMELQDNEVIGEILKSQRALRSRVEEATWNNNRKVKDSFTTLTHAISKLTTDSPSSIQAIKTPIPKPVYDGSTS
jgi:hypothetical protein